MDKIARRGFLSRASKYFIKRKRAKKVKDFWKTKRTFIAPAAIGGGAAGIGAGLGFGFRALRKKKVVEYTDSTRSRIRWYTFKGGPIIVGPTQTMKTLFNTGKRNRQKGLTMLMRLLKSGMIRKEGMVT